VLAHLPPSRHLLLPSACLSGALLSLGLSLLLATPGCKQKSGESCQTSSDCDKGLVCCFDGTNADSSLGICTPGDTCTPIPDAGVDAAQPDAAQPDAAQPDAAQPDAAQPDASESLDASMTQDASP